MLNDKICALRERLNNSILNGEDYEIIYKISIELDDLIANYYKEEFSKNNKKIIKQEILWTKATNYGRFCFGD